ncbi:Phage tail collar domain-containing protein [Azospirillaceae bacterium]|nr:hypothetical protein MTCCP1_00050 [uncultured bacterium]
MSAPPAADCFIGEIRLFGGITPPLGWALCNGQKLAVAEYQPLFSLIGTIYGGDGVKDFALPNLQCVLPIGFGQGKGLPNNYAIGAKGGAYQVTLAETNIPAHIHAMVACTDPATTLDPRGNFFAAMPTNFTEYLSPTATGVTRQNADANMLTSAGAGTPHLNIMPTVLISYIIALNGFYPDFP